MGCITKLLESGAKTVGANNPTIVEGGGFYNGYEYLTVFNDLGFRCGYVAISKNHPLYTAEDDRISELAMHGGCTYFDAQLTDSDCSDKWIGFDCGHFLDENDMEALAEHFPKKAEIYKNIIARGSGVVRTAEYVAQECKGIIDQLVAA